MTDFTPWASLIGGMLIGLGSALLLAFNGRIAGISGILGGLIEGSEGRSWRGLFVVAMLVGGVFWLMLDPTRMPGATIDSLPLLLLAGLLVGFGTRLGGGCTSGHGICGLSRFSTRSVIATALFMASAIVTTFVIRHVLGIGSIT